MDQLIKFVNTLNKKQRMVIIGGFSILFILLTGLLVWSNMKEEENKLSYVIAKDLTKNQVMLASEELEEAGVPFLVTGSGNALTLKTNQEFVNIAKIKLVTSEAATNQHTGWEIFEKSSLGATNFENQVKYLRALEGELSRSLESLNGIFSASVKIAIPKETIFTQKKNPPTASAVLDVRSGAFLAKKQIDGIKNFIASAVPDLKPENIKLIDQNGTLLEYDQNQADSTLVKAQNKHKEEVEQDYEDKIVSLLEPIVGENRVVARVSVDLNFIKRDIYEEIFEPEGTIRSQQNIENVENASGKKVQGQEPGVQSNIEANSQKESDIIDTRSKEETNNITNYEISKKIINYEDNSFSSVKKIAAAVTFDSTALDGVENKEEYIASIASVVQDVIGYDQERGDQVTVKDFKFLLRNTEGLLVDANGNVIEQASALTTIAYAKTILQEFSIYIQYLIAAILILIFYIKFIAKNDIVVLENVELDDDGNPLEDATAIRGFEDEFDAETAHGKLKAKIKNQLLNNIEGLDEESMLKYEVLIEEIDKQIQNRPEEVAAMIEMFLTESEGKKKLKKR